MNNAAPAGRPPGVVFVLLLLLQSGCGGSSQEYLTPVSLAQYNSLDGIYRQLHLFAQENNDTQRMTLGSSVEGRPIEALYMPAAQQGEALDIVFVGGQHAREWLSPATVMRMIDDLIENDRYLDSVRNLLNIWIVPVANPDGYEYSRSVDRLWRKNRAYNADGSRGVDVNRNYAFLWASGKSSVIPGVETYHGEAALSEPETQAIAGLVASLNTVAVIDIHAYSQIIVTVGSNIRATQIAREMVSLMSAASTTPYTASGVALPYYGGSLFEWADSLEGTDGYLLELLPKLRYREQYDWLAADDSNVFAPPATEIETSWRAIKPGVEHLLMRYAAIAQDRRQP